MIVQTAADGLIFTFKGPMSPKNFIFFAAARVAVTLSLG